MDMKTKICTKCGENKALEEYYEDSRHKDGKASQCKSCRNAVQRKYNKSDEGKLTIAKYAKSDKGKLAHAKYDKTDKGKLANARYRESENGKAAHAKYKKSDKGKAAIARSNANRGINVANISNTLKAKEFKYIVHLQDNKCVRCGKTFTKKLIPTRDHIKPVSIGGNFTKETVQALCQSCNSKKGIRYIDYRTDAHKEIIAKNI